MSTAPKRAVAVAFAAVALLVGCTGSPPIATPSASALGADSDAAEAVLRDFIAAINSGDVEAAGALIAPDATVFRQSVASVGIDEALAGFTCTADISSVQVDGETLLVEFDFTGDSALAATPGECKTGPSSEYRVTVRDGQIVEFD